MNNHVKEKKLLSVLIRLSTYFPEDDYIVKINRQELTECIQAALGFVDRRTVYSMIHYLIGYCLIRHNSTSQIIYTGMNKCTPKIMPTNDTKYILNVEMIKLTMKSLMIIVHPHSSSTQKRIEEFK